MHWVFLTFFFGGAFLANALPHIGNGVSGRPFPTPFASPPGKGLSSATINVLWGFFNLGMAYLLIVRIGDFDLRNLAHVALVAAGMLLMALLSARIFGRLHGGQ
ncbi:MAG: hypothetical protein WCC26_06805 [Terracidiphilus sp.]